MKKILIANISILLSTIVGATELSWVDEQIEAIKPPRKGIYISNIQNPFVFLEKNGYEKKQVKSSMKPALVKSTSNTQKEITPVVNKPITYSKLTLELIINASARINGSWYKKSSKINGYTVVAIKKNTVTLKQGDKRLTLSTKTKNKTLKFKNK